jgi:PleD family two-component response regulator
MEFKEEPWLALFSSSPTHRSSPVTDESERESPAGKVCGTRQDRPPSWREELPGPPESAAVLIAGDNATHLEALRGLIENEGHRVLTARLASEAHILCASRNRSCAP